VNNKTVTKPPTFEPHSIFRKMKATAKLAMLGYIASVVLSASLMAQTVAPNSLYGPFLPTPARAVSTVPPNGDVNPYGVAFVPVGFPSSVLQPGDILVSNFNNNQNLQGTGTTIVRIPANGGATSVFFQGNPQSHVGVGLSTALTILKEGLVLVGAFPTADGTFATALPGSVLVLDGNGNLIANLVNNNLINGPWGMTLNDQGNGKFQAFIANALSGTIARYDFQWGTRGLQVLNAIQIASGYLHRGDPAALVVAPSGLVYDHFSDQLYVASTDDNQIFAIAQASRLGSDGGRGNIVYQDNVHLHGALSMARAPFGDLLVSNADVINADPNQPSEIVEVTTGGTFVKQLSVDPNLGGSFGLAVNIVGITTQFAAVDDNASTLTIWTLNTY
jgi:hypothetical protein